MSDVKTLYRRDFVLWSQEQAAALRSAASGGSNQAVDWENVAEEIESLGISQRGELKSQIRRIIEHLLKLEHSSALDPRLGWVESVLDARNEIERILEDSPSLKSEVAASVVMEMRRGSRKAVKAPENYGEVGRTTMTGIQATTYTVEQIIGDWFPPEPDAPPRIAMLTSGATAAGCSSI